MAKTIMICFFVDFIANLAKFIAGHRKYAKNITSASPLIFAINPHAQFGKKLCTRKMHLLPK